MFLFGWGRVGGGGRMGGTCFNGYLLYLENRITLCNTSFTLLTEYQFPVPNGCIVVPNRIDWLQPIKHIFFIFLS